MESPAVGCPVTEETDSYLVGLFDHGGHSGAHGYVITAAYDAVGPQHAHRKIGDMHGTALALAVAGSLAEKLGHHPVYLGTLGYGMAMSSMGGRDPILLGQIGHNPRRDSFLTNVKVYETRDSPVEEKLLNPGLESADSHHCSQETQLVFLAQCREFIREFSFLKRHRFLPNICLQ
jgi:hypothetical protein